MQPVTHPMPPVARFLLTRPIPCGLLIMMVFSAQLWLPPLFQGVPAMVALTAVACMMLNFFAPALTALVAIGGGVTFAAQAGGLAALLVFLIPGVDMVLAIVFALVYVLIPAIAARALLSAGGMTRASDVLVIGGIICSVAALMAISLTQDVAAHEWLSALMRNMLEGAVRAESSQTSLGVPPEAVQNLVALLGWVLPGMVVFTLWTMWGMNLVVARRIATHYGFYHGDPRPVLEFQPAGWSGGLMLISLLAANFGSGDVQYIGVTLALLVGGVLAFNGISIVHLWLRSRALVPLIVLMYVMLMFWSMIVLPFVLLGMLDLWSDYRRKIVNPADAE